MMLARLALPLLVVLAWPASAHADVGAAFVPGDLGDVAVGSSARVFLPVTSTGTEPLAITAVAVDGPVAGDFTVSAGDCTGRMVPALGSCFLGVRFTPTVAVARAASLMVTGNQPASPSAIPSLETAPHRAAMRGAGRRHARSLAAGSALVYGGHRGERSAGPADAGRVN